MHSILISSDRSPFRSKCLSNEITVPVDLQRIFVLIIIHEICSLHNRDQTIFTKDLNRKLRHFRRHLIIIQPDTILLDRRSAGTDHAGKRDLLQISRHKSPASSGAQPCLMSVFSQFADRFQCTVWNTLFHVTDGAVRIKKYCFLFRIHALSSLCKFMQKIPLPLL